MTVEICAVGGYNEVGKNMTAIKVDDDVIICDMGLHLDNYISFTDDDDSGIAKIDPGDLIKVSAVPDITAIEKWRDKVRLIIPTHAHLDHVGAIPFLSNFFDAEILCTPFTTAVIRSILNDEKISLKNKIKTLNINSVYELNNNIRIEFINMTHSTPQTVMVAIHTKYGVIIYANDFKFDSTPVLGQKANIERLREIGKKGILALICDSTYAADARKMPSESVAREMLKDVMLGTENTGKAVIVTTFSSHIARIKSIIEFSKKLNRKVVMLGRSMSRYTFAAKDANIIDFTQDCEIVKFSSKISKKFNSIMKDGKHKYVLIVTGHQGEPKSTISKMVSEKFGFRFDPDDHMIFSCTVIPTQTNIDNRERLEEKLRKRGVRIFKGIHVSGHAAKEDLRDLISLVKPTHLFPAHGDSKMTGALGDLAKEMGYDKKSLHIMNNGLTVKIL